MKRWLRWLFNSMLILSALLCVATAVLWIQHTLNFYRTYGGWGESPQPIFRWMLDEDVVYCEYYRRAATVVSKPTICANIKVPGFSYQHYIGLFARTEELFHLRIRYWFLLAVGSILPMCSWFCTVILRKTRKPKIGMCATCGYDLRATPERCPECGTISAKKNV